MFIGVADRFLGYEADNMAFNPKDFFDVYRGMTKHCISDDDHFIIA